MKKEFSPHPYIGKKGKKSTTVEIISNMESLECYIRRKTKKKKD